jgi:hypothetical protein
MTGVHTLLQTSVADRYRGRIFGALGTSQGLLMLVGTLVAGTLGDRLNVVTMLNIQGGGYILAGLLGLVLLRETQHRVVNSQAKAADLA